MANKPAGKPELPRTKAIGVLQLAQNYVDAASMLDKLRGGISSPRYFLCGHGIELALKALLVASGTSESALRAIGHNLMFAVAAVRQRELLDELHLQPNELSMIEWLNAYYMEKEFEYIFVGLKQFPHPDDLLVVSRRVLDSVTPPVERCVRAAIAARAKKAT